MELRVLGTGTAAPSARRTAASYYVEAGPVRLLMDCGAGTLHRAARYGVPWPALTHVAISHFHLDHWGELPMLFFSLKHGTLPPRRAPLLLIGPRGLQSRLTLLAAAYGDWVLDAGFPLEIREVEAGESVELSPGVTLETCKTPHTAESVAFGVRERTGRLIYTGDTGASDELARWALGCDLLVAECSLPDGEGIDIHLTPSRAGMLARNARARRLVLTHFYPQIEGTDPAAAAAKTFGGDVVAANDGDRFVIGTERC
ncbi:MAG: ribonuclease Z [Gemmatimonadetes bacterium]|nr:ribonuclease Z [Gemmatimonadota bacterium]